MKHLKNFKIFESSLESFDMHLLINKLVDLLKSNNILSIDDISVDNYQKLIKVEDKCSFWVRPSSLLGYYPGEMHTFFHCSATEDGKGEYHFQNKNFYNQMREIIIQTINKLENGNLGDCVNGEVELPFCNMVKPEEEKFDYSSIKPETIQRVKDIWNNLDKKS